MTRTAAALIIGNEILTGKVREANAQLLARELFKLGVALRRVIVCPDDVATIAADLNALRAAHDLVFTSGGVGPTHDDVTLPGVARAFDRPLERSPLIEGLIRGHWGGRVTEGHLRMADVPRGAELLATDAVPWPVIRVENVYVLAGVPEIFELKLAMLRDRIGQGTPFVSRALYTMCDEGEIAALLEEVARAYPDVEIGSYPRWRDPTYRVKLTFDGVRPESVDAALEACRAALPAEAIVRVE
ncbi:MAG: molybdopterin-binding protein [Sandaracinaceae bacterium]|nr:molybdopterin-binding protein [Sandaracinaceae bacterium]